MKITIDHHDKQFNVSLATKEGAEPFITIKGCRVVDGSKGKFVSWPSRKLDSGKYWNHVYASEPFGNAVIAEYEKTKPVPEQRSDYDDSPPF